MINVSSVIRDFEGEVYILGYIFRLNFFRYEEYQYKNDLEFYNKEIVRIEEVICLRFFSERLVLLGYREFRFFFLLFRVFFFNFIIVSGKVLGCLW